MAQNDVPLLDLFFLCFVFNVFLGYIVSGFAAVPIRALTDAADRNGVSDTSWPEFVRSIATVTIAEHAIPIALTFVAYGTWTQKHASSFAALLVVALFVVARLVLVVDAFVCRRTVRRLPMGYALGTNVGKRKRDGA